MAGETWHFPLSSILRVGQEVWVTYEPYLVEVTIFDQQYGNLLARVPYRNTLGGEKLRQKEAAWAREQDDEALG
jgi:hypothetical protein